MFSHLLKTSFLMLLFLTTIGVGNALAQKYTTIGNKSRASTQVSNEAGGKTCSRRDIKKITLFDKKAERYLKKYEELSDLADYQTAPKQPASDSVIKELQEKLEENEKVSEFFNSEEYKKMHIVYRRCGKEIPKRPKWKPFWKIDKDIDGDDTTCLTCSN